MFVEWMERVLILWNNSIFLMAKSVTSHSALSLTSLASPQIFLKTSWMGLHSPSDHWIYNFYFPYLGICSKGKQWDHKVLENFKNMWLCLVSLGRKIKCEPPPEARYQAGSRGKAALSAEIALSCQGCVPAGEDKKSLDRQANWQFGRR